MRIIPRYCQEPFKWRRTISGNRQPTAEPLIYFLVTPARNRDAALSDYFIDATQTRLPIVFSADVCLTSTDSKFVIEQLRKSLFSRDLYDIEEPIQDDVYFFGRK